MAEFEHVFERLTGSAPFPWQRALYDRFLSGDVPASCAIPTGLGKTSVIAIWLIARADGARLPRRLVYVVNRRTVVDQTTEEILRVRERCAAGGLPDDLAISTLRGQMADNRAWSADPSKSAVICGTVDMIGSRLLFSGYRIGFRVRPLHAGFLAQDSLIVHDEAHLEPAFQSLLEAIQAEQEVGDPWPLRVMALTATPRTGAPAFGLGDADLEHEEEQRRLRATKRLALYEVEEKTLADACVEQALRFKDSGKAVVVFLRSVDDVMAVVAKLAKARVHVQQLTGTMRGYERERLVACDPVFARFLRSAAPGDGTRTAYLVCTSAGEVGVNLSADHLVSDLSTFDSMAQRFGRLNRFGLRDDSEAHVLHPPDGVLGGDELLDARRLATLHLLRTLDGDASPAALGSLDVHARVAAFAPSPEILPVTEILFDRWAATTIPDPLPGRPPVEPYLHGVADWEPPTTQVAWRDEVGLLRAERLLAERQDLLDDYPLKPQELLADRTSRVLATLAAIAATTPPDEFPVWRLDEWGNVDAAVTSLGNLVTGDRRRDEQRLAGATVLLSPGHCRPMRGIFSTAGVGLQDPEPGDVADAWLGESGVPLRGRFLGDHDAPPGMRLIRRVALRDEDQAPEPDGAAALVWSWYELPRAADNEGSRSASRPVLLEVHSRDVEREARRIVEALGLEPNLKQAIIIAARLHDIGKDRRAWQLSIGNLDRNRTLAKSGGRMAPIELTPYRHELGSVLDAPEDPLLADLGDEQRDLVLHLIAAHHGRARPHFPARELFDPDAEGAAVEAEGVRIVERFGRLQRRFGRWGLAYLESLVRAADYAASANPSEVVDP
ncbi:MAG: type I-G CRISPR-associated helicase/endonuclease Cas3g [Polyangiaceae bacterium]